MKHSPAPWKFVAEKYDANDDLQKQEVPYDYRTSSFCYNPYIVDAEGNEVVGCDEYCVFSTPENVRLMVHAPELLEALKALVACIDETRGMNAWNALEQANKAISKAEGS
jgi:hypothetical protein